MIWAGLKEAPTLHKNHAARSILLLFSPQIQF